MKWVVRSSLLLTAFLLHSGVQGAPPAGESPAVGEDAPALSPARWFNAKNLTWDKLKGRVILIENWATW